MKKKPENNIHKELLQSNPVVAERRALEMIKRDS